jgi:hypothetical protein
MSWGEPVTVGVSERREHDVLVLSAPARIDGSVAGNVVVIRGDLSVGGRIEGDVLVVLGHVVLEPGAEVLGDALALGGSLTVDPAARVAGSAKTVGEMPRGEPLTYVHLACSRAGMLLRLGCVLFWTMAALAASFAAPAAVVRASDAARHEPVRMGALGLVLHLSVVLLVVLCVALVLVFVGIPLLGIVLFAWLLLKAVGFGAAFHALGGALAERLHARGMSGYAEILLGALVLGALDFVPYVGPIAWMLCAAVGTGAVAATWRRPEAVAVR